MPENTVVVTRASRFWGNPFRVEEWGQYGAVEAYKLWISHHRLGQSTITFAMQMLRGKNLACWCKPGQPCHADVLLEIVNVST